MLLFAVFKQHQLAQPIQPPIPTEHIPFIKNVTGDEAAYYLSEEYQNYDLSAYNIYDEDASIYDDTFEDDDFQETVEIKLLNASPTSDNETFHVQQREPKLTKDDIDLERNMPSVHQIIDGPQPIKGKPRIRLYGKVMRDIVQLIKPLKTARATNRKLLNIFEIEKKKNFEQGRRIIELLQWKQDKLNEEKIRDNHDYVQAQKIQNARILFNTQEVRGRNVTEHLDICRTENALLQNFIREKKTELKRFFGMQKEKKFISTFPKTSTKIFPSFRPQLTMSSHGYDHDLPDFKTKAKNLVANVTNHIVQIVKPAGPPMARGKQSKFRTLVNHLGRSVAYHPHSMMELNPFVKYGKLAMPKKYKPKPKRQRKPKPPPNWNNNSFWIDFNAGNVPTNSAVFRVKRIYQNVTAISFTHKVVLENPSDIFKHVSAFLHVYKHLPESPMSARKAERYIKYMQHLMTRKQKRDIKKRYSVLYGQRSIP